MGSSLPFAARYTSKKEFRGNQTFWWQPRISLDSRVVLHIKMTLYQICPGKKANKFFSVAFMFYNFFSPLARFMYLFIVSLFFIFTFLFAATAKSTIIIIVVVVVAVTVIDDDAVFVTVKEHFIVLSAIKAIANLFYNKLEIQMIFSSIYFSFIGDDNLCCIYAEPTRM